MKIAVCLSADSALARRNVEAMLEAQRHEPDCASRILPFRFGCLGLLGRPGESPADWPVREGHDGAFLAFAGLPIRSGSTGRRAIRGDDAVMREALEDAGPGAVPRLLRQLDGAFVAVAWEPRSGELTIATDFLGMQPLHRAGAGGATLFASEAKAFARAGLLPARPDAGAWAAMVYFGHQVGPRSLLAGATRVEPARALVFRASGDERVTELWRWPSSSGRPDSPSLRDDVGQALRSDVAAYARAYPDASLLLSGGFDSRLILCLCREIGLRPRLLVQSHPDENADADARFAEAIARRLGMATERFPARRDFYDTAEYLRFLERNEISTPSLYLFIPNVAPVVRRERRGVWEGLLLDPALKFDYGDGGFAAYLRNRTGVRRRAYGEAVRLLFAPEWAERMSAEYEELLGTERDRFTDDAEGVWRFSVLNRSRFRTGVNPYQVYDTVTPPLTPGMSRRFWEVVADADPRARFGKRLYRAVFAQLAPEGQRVPVASGASLVRGRGGRLLYVTQRARARVQRVARRERVQRLLRAAGMPTPFSWRPSRLPGVALAEAALDDPRLNAAWIRRRRSGGRSGPADERALELLMYWQAWHHVMGDGLLDAWGSASRD